MKRRLALASVFLFLWGNIPPLRAEESNGQELSECVKASMAIAQAEDAKAKASGPKLRLSPRVLKPYQPRGRKQPYFVYSEIGTYADIIYCVFRYGTKIRLRDGKFVSLSLTVKEHEEICEVQRLLENKPIHIERMSSLLSEKKGEESKRMEEWRTGQEIMDSNLHYFIRVEELSNENKINLINQLTKLDIIESIEFQFPPTLHLLSPPLPSTTISPEN